MSVPFSFTLVASKFDKVHWRAATWEVEQFIHKMQKRGFTQGDKDAAGIIAATFAPNTKVVKENLQTVTGLILDVDNKDTVTDPEVFLQSVGFRALAHTSYSHTPERPKFRVIIPFAQAISPRQFPAVWKFFFDKTGGVSDRQCSNANRMFYLPNVPLGADLSKHWIKDIPGEVFAPGAIIMHGSLDADPLLSEPDALQTTQTDRAPKRIGMRVIDPVEDVDVESILAAFEQVPLVRWCVEEATTITREVWRGLALNLAALANNNPDWHDKCAELFHKLSEPDGDRYSYTAAQKVFDESCDAAHKYGPMTFQTMQNNGAPEELCQNEYHVKSCLALARILAKTRPTPAVQEQSVETTPPVVASTPEKPAPPTVPADPPTPSKPVAPDIDVDSFLYHKALGRWYEYAPTPGFWKGPYSERAVDLALIAAGIKKKDLDKFKANCQRVDVSRAVFDSDEVLVERDGEFVMNTYKHTTLTPQAGDCADLLRLVKHLVKDDTEANEYLLDWLAAPLQSMYNHRKPLKLGTAIVFSGAQGSGKNTLLTAIEFLYGRSNVVILGQDSLDSKFNASLEGALFVFGNEIVSSTNRSTETANKLKSWITESTISIEEKYRVPVVRQNSFNVMLASNDERPVILDADDRRYSIFYADAIGHSITDRLYADFAGAKTCVRAFFDFLLQRKVTRNVHKPYKNAVKETLVEQTQHVTPDKLFVKTILEDGWLSVSQPWKDAAPRDAPREVDIDKAVPSATLIAVYQFFCSMHNLRARNSLHIGGTLMRACPTITSGREYVGGVLTRVYKGVPMRAKDEVVDALVSGN